MALRATTAVEVPPFRWGEVLNGRLLLFVLGLALVYGVLFVLLARVMLTPTGKYDQYVVVLAPWEPVDRVFEISDALKGRVIGLNPRVNAFQLYVTRADAVDALYGAGAWLVLDPIKLGGLLGCGPVPPRTGAPMPGTERRPSEPWS